MSYMYIKAAIDKMTLHIVTVTLAIKLASLVYGIKLASLVWH